MDYIGEHQLPGQIGEFFIALAFSAAILSAVSYFFASKTKESSWKRLARIGFYIHGISVLIVIGTLFFMFLNQYFEYNYIYKYSSKSMPFKYVFSAFWSGQEGSFLLWSFWHIILGFLLMNRGKAWETHTMTVLSLIQIFITSMLLGVYFWDYKFGSNPFLLTRELPEFVNMPFTKLADYLSHPFFDDGKGLNPLLQNYWMTIHPPTLFLGFASTAIPFSFAIAGLWKKDYSGWIKPALPWTFFSVMILGTGILMGGAWAYESLTFGGFWAWDPVENASLVPWIILVAGAHIMLINKHKPKSLYSAFLFILLSFIFILYSTFLTRSGILGDSSVHSFVESGILPQLLVYLLFFVALSVTMLHRDLQERRIYVGACISIFFLAVTMYLFHSEGNRFDEAPAAFVTVFIVLSFVYLFTAYKKHFRTADDEPLLSREFWMFIGALVLFISAVQITFWMSKPVYNHLASPFKNLFVAIAHATDWGWAKSLASGNLSMEADVINTYNRWQIPFTVLITLFIAVTQFMKWGKNSTNDWLKKISISLVISLLLTVAIVLFGGFEDTTYPSNYVLLFTSIFAVVANADYLIRVLKGNVRKGGSAIAHVGFGLLVFGTLLSQSQQNVISSTVDTDISGLSRPKNEVSNQKDQLMYLNDTLVMGDYMSVYTGFEKDDRNTYFHIEYYSQKDKHYKKDDVVYRNQGGLYVYYICARDHTSSSTFIEDFTRDDKSQWYPLPQPTEKDLSRNPIEWRSVDPDEKLFTLSPKLQMNKQFGNANEPDTKHYLDQDLFTYLKHYPSAKVHADSMGYSPRIEEKITPKDTLKLAIGHLLLDSVTLAPDSAKIGFSPNDIVLNTHLRIVTEKRDSTFTSQFIIRDRGNQVFGIPFNLPDERVKADIIKVIPKMDKRGIPEPELTLSYSEHKDNFPNFIVMRAIVFPQINVLWIGCIIMIIGTIIAIIQRIKTNRISRKKSQA